jgi:electron transport complex protein RnfG
MREAVRLGSFLLAVCVLTGAALSGTHVLTQGRILAQREKAERLARAAVLPGAVQFEDQAGRILAFDSLRAPLGFILKASAEGYSGRIEALVGLDTALRVTAVRVLSQTETAGLGAKIASPEFLSQFGSKTPDRLRLRQDGGEIDAVTAATISSRALTHAVRETVDAFQRSVR